jgi:hypothetical protein
MTDILQDLPEITARISYVDTLQIWTAAPLSPEQLRALRAQCGSVRVFSETLRNRPDLKRRYLIQQPSAGALAFLRQEASYVHLINRVDAALDLIVADASAAHQLDTFFLRHKVQRWHGQRRMRAYEGTTYISRDRWTARNLVQYSDMPSKITGSPCCHLELRLMGAEACRRAGIEFLEDLLDLDHRKLWSKELCLRTMDLRKLERHIDEVAGRVLLRQPEVAPRWQTEMGGNITKREAVRRRLKAILANTVSIEGGPEIEPETLHLAPAQRWVEARPGYARRCLIPIPSVQFLPDNSHHVP